MLCTILAFADGNQNALVIHMEYKKKREMLGEVVFDPLLKDLENVGSEGATEYLKQIKKTQANHNNLILIANGLGTRVAFAFHMELIQEIESVIFGEPLHFMIRVPCYYRQNLIRVYESVCCTCALKANAAE